MSLHIMMTNGALLGGGAERVIATLSRRLSARGHRVTIATIADEGEVQDELEADGFETVRAIARHTRGRLGPSAALARIATERDVDVVHTHDTRSLAEAGLSRMRSGGFHHVHTFHFGNYPHLPWKHLALEGVFARMPDQLVAVGNIQRQSIVRTLRLSPHRVETIWNGVDATCSEPDRQTVESRDDTPLVGSVSAFFPQKGLPTLLEAASLVHRKGIRFRLQLVGDGPIRPALEAQVSRLGLGTVVEFRGWVPNASASVLPAFDIFVQSSHWEAMSLVVLEAMAAGRPILATTVGENPAVLADERTAILVPPRDAEALASSLARLLTNQPLRARLGAAARASYAASFTGGVMADRYISMYKRLLVKGAARMAVAP